MDIVGHIQHFGKWVRKKGGGTTSLVMAEIYCSGVEANENVQSMHIFYLHVYVYVL
jgi:hypothetical protein